MQVQRLSRDGLMRDAMPKKLSRRGGCQAATRQILGLALELSAAKERVGGEDLRRTPRGGHPLVPPPPPPRVCLCPAHTLRVRC